MFFSDIEDVKRYIALPLSVNWQHIAARLVLGFQLSRSCGLREIEDVPGGECITLSRGGERRTVLWHAARFCVEDGLQDEQSAANKLRSTVHSVVSTLAADHSDILVLLSGGLDSSIVTSCLAQQHTGPHVTCLNFYIATADSDYKLPDIAGVNKESMAKLRRVIGDADERRFAESVARKWRFNLVEKEQTVRDLDFRRIKSAPLATRPSNYIYAHYQDDVESACVADHRATACFTGIGGDTVFYCTLRAIGALDYAYVHPFGPRLFHHIAATALLSRESYPRVLGKTIKYGLFRRSLRTPYDPMKQSHLLRDEAFDAVAPDFFHHPWVDMSYRLCPGKHSHVVGVATSVPTYPYVYFRDRIAPTVSPLASQPVVETCLRIPTYVLLADGLSRGLARRAFADLLPAEVTRRTTKGGGLAFWQRLIRHNMAFVRECLLEGTLVRNALLDRKKLEGYLIPEQPFLAVQPHQIMNYLACELWLSQWTIA